MKRTLCGYPGCVIDTPTKGGYRLVITETAGWTKIKRGFCSRDHAMKWLQEHELMFAPRASTKATEQV